MRVTQRFSEEAMRDVSLERLQNAPKGDLVAHWAKSKLLTEYGLSPITTLFALIIYTYVKLISEKLRSIVYPN